MRWGKQTGRQPNQLSSSEYSGLLYEVSSNIFMLIPDLSVICISQCLKTVFDENNLLPLSYFKKCPPYKQTDAEV